MTDRKKPASKSPTQRTLAWLRKMGYTVGITEHWNGFIKRRQDLFGCIDLIAIKALTPSSLDVGMRGCLGIQATTGSNVAARATKILALPAAKVWVESGNKLWVVGWKKYVATNRWEPIIRDMLIGDFE